MKQGADEMHEDSLRKKTTVEQEIEAVEYGRQRAMKLILGIETGPGTSHCLKCDRAIFGSPKTVLLEAASGDDQEPLRTLGEFCPKCSKELIKECDEYPGVNVRSSSEIRWFLTDVAANLRILADEIEASDVLDVEEE